MFHHVTLITGLIRNMAVVVKHDVDVTVTIGDLNCCLMGCVLSWNSRIYVGLCIRFVGSSGFSGRVKLCSNSSPFNNTPSMIY